jgi:signal transduction histidine kinase
MKGVALEAILAERPAVALAHPDAIRRLLLILIDNAVKHMPAGGSVTVGTAAHEHQIVLSVLDSGEGIDPEVLPHVFERFSRSVLIRTARLSVSFHPVRRSTHAGHPRHCVRRR